MVSGKGTRVQLQIGICCLLIYCFFYVYFFLCLLQLNSLLLHSAILSRHRKIKWKTFILKKVKKEEYYGCLLRPITYPVFITCCRKMKAAVLLAAMKMNCLHSFFNLHLAGDCYMVSRDTPLQALDFLHYMGLKKSSWDWLL